MDQVKIVVLDGYTLNPGDLSWDELKSLGKCIIYERTAPDQLLERAKDAEILLTNKTILTADNIAALPGLKYIGVLATGYNVVDIEAARKSGIIVTNIPVYSTKSVAQTVFAHILTITQRVEHYTNEIAQGAWTESRDFSYWDTPLVELDGLKMGIIGLGHIGKTVAGIAISFGMEVLAYTSKTTDQLPEGVKSVSLDVLFKESDVISLHSPLTDSTTHLVNADRLAMMKPTSILINTARGGLVNEQDLADALNNRIIYAAGLDVLSTEPPTPNNPLLAAKNCFITPHIAWATKAARKRLMTTMLDNIKGYLAGNVINSVTD